MTTVGGPTGVSVELDDAALASFVAGEESRLHELLGAHRQTRGGVSGVRFAVWAPRAAAVHLMGSFNDWDADRAPMRPVADTGVWELFVPGVDDGALYKYQVRIRSDGGVLAIDKADPLGREMEVRPRTASLVVPRSAYVWGDSEWVAQRSADTGPGSPISIYEAHLGSWRRRDDGAWLTYRELAAELLPYVKDLGFTHVELLPLTEHPHDASWGYQTLGFFAPTSRYGRPDDLRFFVDEAHRLGLGVVLDWVPGHFPLDLHGLRAFDGKPLYEVEDETQALHPDWGTLVFDYQRPEVVSFLVSSARYWVEEFHVDGLRVDAVASMLYLDYSREEGEWIPNEDGGNENFAAADFLKTLTTTLHATRPGVLLFAEESTTWPGVTRPVDEDGLGFDFKWSLGWMNDTLGVLGADPHRRSELHKELTFSLHYAHDERHLLPLSHDEVVHLKRSLLSKMPGGYDAKFAGLRLLLGYMWTHPGAKLLFMGGEIGQWSEWDADGELAWGLLGHKPHSGLQRWVRALNEVYVRDPSLHVLDDTPEGFEWLDVHDARRSVLTYLRWRHEWDDFVLVVANFSSSAWPEYRVAAPVAGDYEIVLDSESVEFGGSGGHRLSGAATETRHVSRPASLTLDLAPLSCVLLKRAQPED